MKKSKGKFYPLNLNTTFGNIKQYLVLLKKGLI
nr:MAG TPA: hypothetical protein [Caudoviricetes sp.]